MIGGWQMTGLMCRCVLVLVSVGVDGSLGIIPRAQLNADKVLTRGGTSVSSHTSKSWSDSTDPQLNGNPHRGGKAVYFRDHHLLGGERALEQSDDPRVTRSRVGNPRGYWFWIVLMTRTTWWK